MSSAPTVRCLAVRSFRPALTQNLRNAGDRFWQILLKKSKIGGHRKSRESRCSDVSTAAMLARGDAKVRGRFCERCCGPSRRGPRNASAVLKNFARQPEKTFSTVSAQSGHSLERRDQAKPNYIAISIHMSSQVYSEWRAKLASFRIKTANLDRRIAAHLTDTHELIAAKDQRICSSPLGRGRRPKAWSHAHVIQSVRAALEIAPPSSR